MPSIAEQVLDAERRHQRQLLVELEARRGAVVRAVHPERRDERHGRAGERGQPHEQRTMTRGEHDDDGAHKRRPRHDREQWQAVHQLPPSHAQQHEHAGADAVDVVLRLARLNAAQLVARLQGPVAEHVQHAVDEIAIDPADDAREAEEDDAVEPFEDVVDPELLSAAVRIGPNIARERSALIVRLWYVSHASRMPAVATPTALGVSHAGAASLLPARTHRLQRDITPTAIVISASTQSGSSIVTGGRARRARDRGGAAASACAWTGACARRAAPC